MPGGTRKAGSARRRRALGPPPAPPPPQWIIEKKRDGHALSDSEIRSFVGRYTSGRIPDYQMAALAMAVYFRGMSPGELAALTDAMTRSGATLDTSSIRAPKVDKHSTGGIGDKTSLVLAPLVACCGVAVPMISGRGLGITGGTLDKLESIPGYRTRLPPDRFLGIVRDCGCSIVGQSDDLAPADRKLYALRDVTGTVPSVPLISASIMSKKLAEGIDGLVLDVKCGSGAFMKTPAAARELARAMAGIGAAAGKGIAALITDMNQPLGRSAGNALEIAESVETLSGRGPDDLLRLVLELGARMLLLGGRAAGRVHALATLRRKLADGEALARFIEMVRLHGGDPDCIRDPGLLPAARLRREIPAPRAGFVARADADGLGRACLLLGAGRQRTDDAVDHAAGMSGIAKIGERVERRQPLAVLHANDRGRIEQALGPAAAAFEVTAEPPPAPRLILDCLAPDNPREDE